MDETLPEPAEIEIRRGDWRPAPRALPDGRALLAIGDVHGQSAHLARLLEALRAEIAALQGEGIEDVRLVYLGDLIDRGPDSAGALRLAGAGLGLPGVRQTILAGNHDVWLRAAWRGELSASDLRLWLYNGGGATLESFGLTGGAVGGGLDGLSRALDARLDADQKRALESLQLLERVDGYLLVHAGLDPRRGRDEQSEETLLWIREPFLNCPARRWPFEEIVVHGHTPERDAGRVHGHRINLDSGCATTGRLTALVVAGARLRTIVAEGPPAWGL